MGRLIIDDIRPRTPEAAHPAKAVVGEPLSIRAVIFKEGHDILAAQALVYPERAGEPEAVVPLAEDGNDIWSGVVVPARLGRYSFVVQAWTDRHATWAHKVEVKLDAGQDITVEIAEGEELLSSAEPDADGRLPAAVATALVALRDPELVEKERVADALGGAVAAATSGPYGAVDLTTAAPVLFRAERERAAVGAWYELFPRSHGGFGGIEPRVTAIAAMGFDVLYLPPIHPIGVSHRKGPNNTLDPGPDDPGSPWAIGSGDGGHTSVHPELGTLEDFDRLVRVVADAGMEIALDYALQCSPDHPWVTAHPEWFHHRPDGSIAYAENPPKKYQDIFPINFWPPDDADRVALWQACKDILDFWIGHGVNIFRVDNPHTKPLAFWEWVIPAVLAEHPEIVFLAEAFTRPHMMAKLAEVGFSQSYTYFAWRTERDGAEGLWAYLEELAEGPASDYLRPAFWPNTPDILAGPLRDGSPQAFALRLVLAATGSPTYGIYSGFEVCENRPASPANEEYLDSEKYQIVVRNYDRPGTLAPLITHLNAIRRRHPALRTMRSLRLHPVDNSNLIAYSKRSPDGADVVLVVVNLDPGAVAEGTVTLQLDALGVDAARPFQVFDELSGATWSWQGERAYLRLDPARSPAHVLVVRQP